MVKWSTGWKRSATCSTAREFNKRRNSKYNDSLSVAVVSGKGIKVLKTANANQYFAGGGGYPDYVVFISDLSLTGTEAIKAAVFFRNDWSLQPEDLK